MCFTTYLAQKIAKYLFLPIEYSCFRELQQSKIIIFPFLFCFKGDFLRNPVAISGNSFLKEQDDIGGRRTNINNLTNKSLHKKRTVNTPSFSIYWNYFLKLFLPNPKRFRFCVCTTLSTSREQVLSIYEGQTLPDFRSTFCVQQQSLPNDRQSRC